MTNTRPVGAPVAAPVADWGAAERNAQLWLRWLGHNDAVRTRSGADDGIDVRAADAIAQVKWYGKPVGVRPVRELVGAAEGSAATRYFFCNAGFTRDAISYADRVGMALYVFSPADGMISGVNQTARQAFAAAIRRHTATPPTTTRSPHAHLFAAPTVGDRPPRPAPRPVGAVWLSIALIPFAMCAIGAVVVAFLSQYPHLAPPWMREVWATWMTVGILGAALVMFVTWIRRSRR